MGVILTTYKSRDDPPTRNKLLKLRWQAGKMICFSLQGRYIGTMVGFFPFSWLFPVWKIHFPLKWSRFRGHVSFLLFFRVFCFFFKLVGWNSRDTPLELGCNFCTSRVCTFFWEEGCFPKRVRPKHMRFDFNAGIQQKRATQVMVGCPGPCSYRIPALRLFFWSWGR